MYAYGLNGTISVDMTEDEYLELHEELMCCEDMGPYMDKLFTALSPLNNFVDDSPERDA